MSKPEVLEKLHDSIRLANRDDRNRSCSSMKAAYNAFHSIVSPLCLLWAHVRQVLLEDMPGFFFVFFFLLFSFFSRGSPVFTTPTDWLVSYELNDLKRDVN